MTIRFAFPDDEGPLGRLAVLDSAAVPQAPVLLAEVGGEPRAALSLSDGSVIADPFHFTEELVSLLEARAMQLRDAPRKRRRRGLRRVGLAARAATLR